MAMQKGTQQRQNKNVGKQQRPVNKSAAAKPLPTRNVAKWNNPSKPTNSKGMYTLSEFVENIRGYCGLESRAQAKSLCDDMARFIKDAMKKGYVIPLFGLGKLFIKQTKARMTRNPATGQMMKVPARKRVRFSANKVLKDLVK